MITLAENERVLMIVRRHWFALARPTAFLFFLLIMPSLVFGFAGATAEKFVQPELQPVVNFIFSLYVLGILLYGFILWADYYLDVWIITSKRLIDIQQKGLFNRSVSELGMDKVQDVTIKINGFVQTMLKFGNLEVQTASQSTFIIKDAPHLYEAKELILRYSQGLKMNSNGS
ncbi:MAG: PH domain-containing protein [bacterium]|nr:PH domain-containing protein [bacterium]